MEYSLLVSVACIFLQGLGRVEGIVNGSLATLGEFPYMAAIVQYDWIICGGALISDRHVLTAAHCVTDDTFDRPPLTNLTVEFGMIKRTNISTGLSIKVDKVAPHPMFFALSEPFDVFNDIAVLTLKNPVTMSKFVRPISLPEKFEKYTEDTPFSFCGFSTISASEPQSKYLKKMLTSAVSLFDCRAKYTDITISSDQLCAVEGSCRGDSGGPLTIDGKVIVGINSIGSQNCLLGRPDVYTQVSHHIDYIRGEMAPPEPRNDKVSINTLTTVPYNLTMLMSNKLLYDKKNSHFSLDTTKYSP